MSDNKVEAEQFREQVEKMDRILEACWRYFDHCLQEARAEVDRLRRAIRQHRWEMREYKGAFYDEALWQAVPETQESSHDQPAETKAAGIVANHAGDSVGIRGVGQ